MPSEVLTYQQIKLCVLKPCLFIFCSLFMTVLQPENISAFTELHNHASLGAQYRSLQSWWNSTTLQNTGVQHIALNHLDLHLTRQNKLNDIKDIVMTTIHWTLYNYTTLLSVGTFTTNAALNGTYQILPLIQTCRDWTLPTYKGWNSKQFWWNHICYQMFSNCIHSYMFTKLFQQT